MCVFVLLIFNVFFGLDWHVFAQYWSGIHVNITSLIGIHLLQQASGIYAYLKDTILSHVQGDPTPDLHPDTLGALSSLMLAQAQETLFYN